MKRMKQILTMCVLLTMAVALGGCQGDKPQESSQIIVGIPQDLEDSLDPHKAVAAGTKEVLFNVYEGLLKPDPDGNIYPAVAESYEVSEDGKTYTFTLRKGVKFHDGSTVTAEDVKYSLEKAAGMTGETPLVAAFSLIESVEIADEQTVVIKLSATDVDFPCYLAMTTAAIIPKSNATPDTNPIGTGPYMYVSRSPQENIIVKKFNDYWGEPANIENVTFKIVSNADTIVMNLKGGSIDMYARLTTDQIAQLGDEFEIYEGTMNLVQALYLNNAVEPFNNEKVRQAMCYAVDVKGMLELTTGGKGTPVGSSMFPAFKKYYMEELASTYPHDVEKAKALLAEAGYPDGFTMSISVPSNYQPHIDTAQVLVEQLKEAGITANIQLIEWNSWLSDVYTNRDYESTVVGVDASSMTAAAMLSRFASTADNNFVNFSDAEYDKLYEESLSCTDDTARTQLYKDMEKILADRAANVYLQDMAEFVAVNKRIEGYTFYPLYVQDIAKLKLK